MRLKCEKIVLLGYMGSGKTQVGQLISELLSIEFIDLDQQIEKLENRSVAQIFEEKGAIYFRKRERSILMDLINKNNRCVLSLGGGTPCYYDNMELINNHVHTKSIYLDASIPILTQRLIIERAHRPLIANMENETDLMEFIGKHLFERRAFYQMADLKVNTSDLTPIQVASAVIKALR
ncbi:MAG: shikimate kinase [Nonlabens sp.]